MLSAQSLGRASASACVIGASVWQAPGRRMVSRHRNARNTPRRSRLAFMAGGSCTWQKLGIDAS